MVVSSSSEVAGRLAGLHSGGVALNSVHQGAPTIGSSMAEACPHYQEQQQQQDADSDTTQLLQQLVQAHVLGGGGTAASNALHRCATAAVLARLTQQLHATTSSRVLGVFAWCCSSWLAVTQARPSPSHLGQQALQTRVLLAGSAGRSVACTHTDPDSVRGHPC